MLSIHDCMMKFSKRAEDVGDTKLVETFVEAGPLTTILSTPCHQIIFGRRGTGKTHALKFLASKSREQGDFSIYIDLRIIGSNVSIYNDPSISIKERASILLADVLNYIHDGLLDIFIENAEELNLSVAGPLLDNLVEGITNTTISGPVEQEISQTDLVKASENLRTDLKLNPAGLAFGLSESSKSEHQVGSTQRQKATGEKKLHIIFGSITKPVNSIMSAMKNRSLWVLLDEWSVVPVELQPYLADMLRRCLYPISKVHVKIAAIEYRSKFKIEGEHGDYIGIEIGADAAADLDLDDFMVFDNDATKAKEFFQNLLFKHYRATDGLDDNEGAQTSSILVQELFTQTNSFEEFVRAVEGVPRDAMHIIATAARQAYGQKVSVHHIRKAALDWYNQGKASFVKDNHQLSDLLEWIIGEVIKGKRARAFLLSSRIKHELIDKLFDGRLLHLLKKNISSHDQPGVRYDVYKLDYGCYVDLITTNRSPIGLLPLDTEGGDEYVDVPPDDYRSIRRAILDLDKFLETRNSQGKQ